MTTRQIYRARSTPDDFTDVVFPGKLNDCQMCHLPGTYTLPVKDTLKPTVIRSSGYNVNGFGNGTIVKITQPVTSVCTTCHDSTADKGHASAMTSNNVETCNVCHAEGKDFAVTKVHAK